MGKRSRYTYQAANEFGEVLSKSSNYSLTEADIIKTGNQFVKLSSTAILTLPTPTLDLDGIVVRVFNSGSGKVTCVSGFGGQGSIKQLVNLASYETIDFWCDGEYWYAMTEAVVASSSSSSSSSTSA